VRLDLLELPEIPRDRNKLKAVIGRARYEARRSKLIRLTAYVMIGIVVLILLLNACFAHTPTTIPHMAVYLPIIIR
jgi:hypothetical protein